MLRLTGFVLLSVAFDTRFAMFEASFVGALAISDMLKTTLGPKGMVSAYLSSSDPSIRLSNSQ